MYYRPIRGLRCLYFSFLHFLISLVWVLSFGRIGKIWGISLALYELKFPGVFGEDEE